MKKQLLLFATCVALLSGCKDNDENGRPDSPATQPAITAFVFEAARNPQTLIMDIKCAIDGNEISGLIPYATDLQRPVRSDLGKPYGSAIGRFGKRFHERGRLYGHGQHRTNGRL